MHIISIGRLFNWSMGAVGCTCCWNPVLEPQETAMGTQMQETAVWVGGVDSSGARSELWGVASGDMSSSESSTTTTWNWDRKAVYNDGVSLFWTKWFQKTVLLLEDFPGMTASSRTDGSELAKGNTLQQRQLPSKLNGEGSILIHSEQVDCSNHAIWNPILTHRVFHIFFIYIVNDIVNLWAGR